jgi:hypothetical protein
MEYRILRRVNPFENFETCKIFRGKNAKQRVEQSLKDLYKNRPNIFKNSDYYVYKILVKN